MSALGLDESPQRGTLGALSSSSLLQQRYAGHVINCYSSSLLTRFILGHVQCLDLAVVELSRLLI